jgi:hypothetical protein
MARLHRETDAIHLILEADEVDVLTTLATGLARRVTEALHGSDDDVIIDRFAPTVSRGSADLDAELRSMLRGDLLSTRAERLAAFADELRASQERGSGVVDRSLDRDAALRVVESLNDLRLALATTIGYDDGSREVVGPDDARWDAVGLMDALAWLQGGLIEFVDGDG